MTAQIAEQKTGDIARSVKALVPLIKQEARRAKEAADEAALPHWLNIGLMLIEAKPQLPGRFETWIKDNFDFGERHARKCMGLARATLDKQIGRGRAPETFSDAMRESGREPRGAAYGGAAWREPIREALTRASNIRNLHEENLKREAEREAERKLGLRLIDIGFKALATKLHPDHGGSREAMARLNHVRDRLKKFV